ncbi:MAG: FtsX-like permease family protein [Planctomycetota bacterium]
MFKLLLISKYLRRKLAPLFAAVAVMLCTAMVIIVMSVMGGFLDQFRASARNLTGDIVVEGPLQGFAGYESLLTRVTELPEVVAGTPVIETFGLINFRDDAKPVRVQGLDFATFEEIVGYRDTLYWTPDQILAGLTDIYRDDGRRAQRLRPALTRDHPVDPRLSPPTTDPVPDNDSADETPDEAGAQDAPTLPEALIGIEVNPIHFRDERGDYDIGRTWAGAPITLTVVPISAGGGLGGLEQERREFLVVNEFKSGLFDIDGQMVFVPFPTLQKMLNMHEREAFDTTGFDPETGEGGRAITVPGRANRLVLKTAPGVDVALARTAVQKAILEHYADRPFATPPRALTWEDVHGQILGAVENEKGLITFLFGVIGIVAIVMVATTFYMIVLEKTRDIGVLRAIGASRGGIIGLFLGYGLAIGVVGSLLGLLISIGVVTNLNEIQDLIYHATYWLDERMIQFFPREDNEQPQGWRMWNPQTYFFDRIPDQMNYAEAWWAVFGAIVSSVIGATLPALLAGRLKPVEALRYE